MDVRIRPSTIEDAPGLAALNVVTWRAAYTGIIPDRVLDGLEDDDLLGLWRERILYPESRVGELWVADGPDGVCAYTRTGLTWDSDLDRRTVGEVYGMYAHPDVWGSGLPQRIFRHALEELRGQGVTDVVLWVVEANARARRFYEKEGFEPDGMRGKPFYGATQVRYSNC